MSIAAITISLTACPSPETPKADLGAVTITVLDRFERPVPGITFDVNREVRRAMTQEPFESVAKAVTGENGQTRIPDLKEDDWIALKSLDIKFEGKLKLKAGKTDYSLKLDHPTDVYASLGRDVMLDTRHKMEDTVAPIFNKILDDYVAEERPDFLSLDDYLAQGLLSQIEFEEILKIAPRMIYTSDGINFLWGQSVLRFKDSQSPLQWIND